MKHFLWLLIFLLAACSPAREASEYTKAIVLDVNLEDSLLKLKLLDDPRDVVEAKVSAINASFWKTDDFVKGVLTNEENAWSLDRVWPAQFDNEKELEDVAARLRQSSMRRGKGIFRTPGEHIPIFALYDQEGKLFHSDSLKGKYTVMNFIFTRCNNPQMCPLATSKMIRLQQLATEAGFKRLNMVSISFDSEYDTPAVLKEYADMRNIDTNNFKLVSGPTDVVSELEKQLGIFTTPDEEAIIKHTLMMTVIDPEGKIIEQHTASKWDPIEVLNKLQKLNSGNP